MSSRRRQMMAILPLSLMLSREALIAKEGTQGKEGLRPLDIVIHSSVRWARAMPEMRSPPYEAYLNATAIALLVPSHVGSHVPDAEQSWLWSAWQSAARAYVHLMDEDSTVLRFMDAPFPNAPVLGSYAIVFGAILAPFVPGLSEYLIIGGCLAIMRARVKLDSPYESRHPLQLMTTCAALMLVVIMRG